MKKYDGKKKDRDLKEAGLQSPSWRNAGIAGLIVLGVLSSVNLNTVYAQGIPPEHTVDHKIIFIQQSEGLVPNVAIVKQGTTVIWINYTRDPMEVKFLGQQTKLACGKPVNFFIGKTGGYQSQKLETGVVASLCFIEKGEYEYQLERTGDWSDVDKRRFRGTVKVY
jgi:plastocyanin